MQFLKRPFYYQNIKLNEFIIKKALNYKYYPKFLICENKTTGLAIKTKLIKKTFQTVKNKTQKKIKKKGKKRLIKVGIEQILNEIYLSTFDFIEYIEADFVSTNKATITKGFSYKMKEKYFSNTKITNHDFIEKTFYFNSCRNYLNNFYKHLRFISVKNNYKTVIPLQPKKGGFIVFGNGCLGAIKTQGLHYMAKNNLTSLMLNSFYLLPTFNFFSTKLAIQFKKKTKKTNILKKKLQFYFLNSKF